MPLFRVYYPSNAHTPTIGFMFDGDGVEAATLRSTHRMVALVEAEDLEGVFEYMNTVFPSVDVRDLIEAVGVRHTSMSVGDVAVDEDDNVHVVGGVGFRKVGKLPNR